LLGGLRVDRPNQVWCADITYLPMRRGFLYLVAIMDWFTRKVLAWRVSNTPEANFCVEALSEACTGSARPRSQRNAERIVAGIPTRDRSSRRSPGPIS
jgi:transposase InsO family protein